MIWQDTYYTAMGCDLKRGSYYSFFPEHAHTHTGILTGAQVSPVLVQTRSLLLTHECLRSWCWMSLKERKPQVISHSLRAAYHLITAVKATLKLHCWAGELMCHPARIHCYTAYTEYKVAFSKPYSWAWMSLLFSSSDQTFLKITQSLMFVVCATNCFETGNPCISYCLRVPNKPVFSTQE